MCFLHETKRKEDYSTVKCTLRHLKRTINKYVRSIGDPGSIVINTLVLSLRGKDVMADDQLQIGRETLILE